MRRFKNSVLFSGFAFLALIGFLFFILFKGSLGIDHGEIHWTSKSDSMVSQNSDKGPQGSLRTETNTNNTKISANGTIVSRAPSGEEVEAPSPFRVWLKEESKSLNSTNINTAQKEIEMKSKAEKLNATDRGELVSTALNSGSTVNERILATYLLSLNFTQGSDLALSQVAEAPLPDLGIPAVHSAAELQRVQELSLRYTMVDELAQRARKDSQSLVNLKKLIESASSSEVRNYARRKAAEIRSL